MLKPRAAREAVDKMGEGAGMAVVRMGRIRVKAILSACMMLVASVCGVLVGGRWYGRFVRALSG